MGFFDFILGKKKIIKDAYFGEIVSQRIKNKNPNEEYSWYIDYRMPNAQKDSQIILEGNSNQPNPIQLEALKSILKNLTDLYRKMDLEVNKINPLKEIDQRLIVKNWEDEYFLSMVYPLNGQNPEFELCFDPIDAQIKNPKFIVLDYAKGEIQKMTF